MSATAPSTPPMFGSAYCRPRRRRGTSRRRAADGPRSPISACRWLRLRLSPEPRKVWSSRKSIPTALPPKRACTPRYHSRSRRPSVSRPSEISLPLSTNRQEGRPQGSPACASRPEYPDPLRRAGTNPALSLRSGSSAGGERRATPPFGVHGRQVGHFAGLPFRGTAICEE